MNKWLRKLRGIVGTGAVWGTAGLSVGAFLGAISSIIFDGGFSLTWMLSSGAGLGLFGFLSGVSFAGTLATLDGRRSLEDLSVARSALWGLIAGAASAFLFVLIRDGTLFLFFWERMLPPIAALGTLGACLGAGTILIARKATDELPPRTGESPKEPIESSSPPQLKTSKEAQESDPIC
ncbi:MAG: hypothetical protein ACYSUQ_09225 [Planctomycetota bacterium]|jgi:hypothetical protein